MTSVGNTSLTMTTTKAFLTGQKQQQQLCCTTKVTALTWQGQHNTVSTTKLSKASVLTCGICETEQIAKGTKLLNNWMKVMVPDKLQNNRQTQCALDTLQTQHN